MVFLELGKYIGSLFRGHIFSRVPSVDINFSHFHCLKIYSIEQYKFFVIIHIKLEIG